MYTKIAAMIFLSLTTGISNGDTKNLDMNVPSMINCGKQEVVRQIQSNYIEKSIKEILEETRIDNVSYDPYDVTKLSGITHEEMKEILSESHYRGLLEMSDAFVDGEQKYGINAFVLAGIPAIESGWNTSERTNNGNNNVVGMNVTKNVSRGTVYDSKYNCIMDLARQLKTYYVDPNAMYYNGNSLEQINKYYSETSY